MQSLLRRRKKRHDDERKSFNHVDGFGNRKYLKRKLINYISVIPSHHYLISLHSRLAPKHDLFHLIYTSVYMRAREASRHIRRISMQSNIISIPLMILLLLHKYPYVYRIYICMLRDERK